jgi:hypothetical protein
VTEAVTRIFVGRGLRGEPVEEATDEAAQLVELSVNLAALQVELEQAMLDFDLLPRRCWMPLSTTVGGIPELVFDDSDGLIPSLVPIAHLAAEDKTVKTEEEVTP